MLTVPLLIHLLALATWAGCVLVEVLLELIPKRSNQEAFNIADYHFYIDLFIEIPLLTTILASGFYLLQPAHLQGWFLIKIVLGLTAIGANLFCAVIVILRHRAGHRGDILRVNRLTRFVFASIAGAPAGVAALVIGLSYMQFA